MGNRDYFIGLDMGTNSVGWAVTNPQYELLKAKGKDLWGIREFDSAEGAREIITSSRDGYLIKHRNHDMMIRKIEDLIKDENKRKELGSNDRKKVIKIYSKESVLEEGLKLIEQ